MNKRSIFFFLALAVASVAHSDPVGESAYYQLNDSSDRTSWIIRGGEGNATVTEYRNDEKLGPSYVVSIEYSLNVIFHGQQNGVIGLLVPASMFEDQFYEDLKQVHPVSLGAFDVDYRGMSRAHDNDNNAYDQCMLIKIFNLNPDYRPVINSKPKVTVLSHESFGPLGAVEDLVLNLKTHELVPVLGAVQIDISGKARGVNFRAGLDFNPGH